MNKRQRMVLIALIGIMAVLMAGCNLVRVNEEKDRQIVVAKVNGKEILKGAVLDQYRANYGVPEEYDEQILTGILDALIEEELVKQKAEAAGYVLNDEVINRAREEYEQSLKDYAEALREEAGEDDDSDTDYLQKAKEKMSEYYEAAGLSEEEYIENWAKYIAIQDYLDQLTNDITVTETEIEEFYQEELEFQLDNPSLAAFYSSVKVVEKPASRTVKHILIKLSDEDMNAISSLRQENKSEEADELRDEKLAEIRKKAEDVLVKAKAGEDFEALIKEYGEDPGMENEENKDGYSMYKDSSMYPEFIEASFKLKEGEISDLVATDAGYHIIKVYEANEDEITPLDEIKDKVQEVLLNQKKSIKIDEFIAEWLEEADIKKYERRL